MASFVFKRRALRIQSNHNTRALRESTRLWSHLGLGLTPKELSDKLLSEQAIIAQYVDSLSELESQVLACEIKFGIPSSEVHEAIEAGRLQETEEVCNWILDFELLQRVKPGGQ